MMRKKTNILDDTDCLINWGYVLLSEIENFKVHQGKVAMWFLSNCCFVIKTVHLGVLDAGEVLYLAKEESSQTIRMISKIGKRAPLHCTALGKVLLAYMPEEERKKFLEGKIFPSLTENTIIDKEELEKELDKVKEQRFTFDNEENEKC